MHCTTTFHLYFISLYIETKMLLFFKEVNALFLYKLPFNERNEKKINKKKMVFESYSEHISGMCSTFFT